MLNVHRNHTLIRDWGAGMMVTDVGLHVFGCGVDILGTNCNGAGINEMEGLL